MLFFIGILLGGAVVIFALQNEASVMVTFLGWNFEGSISLIIVLAMLAGVVISLLFSLSSFITNMMAESKLKGHNEALRRELDDHKTMLEHANKKIAEKEESVTYTEKRITS